MLAHVLQGDCTEILDREAFERDGIELPVRLTFLDPPFNQGKDYAYFDDAKPEDDYWGWMEEICGKVFTLTAEGGAVYFMQREKNTEHVLRCLRRTGWTFQNLITWRKLTSAVPGRYRYGKAYQVIGFATKGERAAPFHRLRIDAPLRPGHREPRKNGVFVTDCWDDIRELTAGYFAGDEALRNGDRSRSHEQQAPVALLTRIILSSTSPDDLVLDPFVGTGTTLVAAEQLGRRSVGVEIDPQNVALVQARLSAPRKADAILPLRRYYRFTAGLEQIWPAPSALPWGEPQQMVLLG